MITNNLDLEVDVIEVHGEQFVAACLGGGGGGACETMDDGAQVLSEGSSLDEILLDESQADEFRAL